MLKFKKINFAEYVLNKCRAEAWELLKDIDFNIRPTKPRLLREGLIKITLQFKILGRNNKPDFTCDLDEDNCFLFSLDGEILKRPYKEEILLKIEEVKNEYKMAFL